MRITTYIDFMIEHTKREEIKQGWAIIGTSEFNKNAILAICGSEKEAYQVQKDLYKLAKKYNNARKNEPSGIEPLKPSIFITTQLKNHGIC